jgi:proteasome lid subunit RPN8/RPN11
MLYLSSSQLQRIVAQGLEGKPLEICGLLAGRKEGDKTRVEEVYPIESDDKSELTYSMNPLQMMKAERAAREAGLAIVGIYHTHPATVPYPSKTDVERAHWEGTDDLNFPGYSYLIVSLRNPDAPEPRSFKINGRRIPNDIEEEAVAVE